MDIKEKYGYAHKRYLHECEDGYKINIYFVCKVWENYYPILLTPPH